MVLMAGYDLPLRAIREQVASALDLIVQLNRMPDGSRKVVSITEVQRMESDVITMQEIFRYEDGEHAGFKATGLRPTFIAKLDRKGVELPPSMSPRGSQAGLRAVPWAAGR
jgi:pilus assembly protein CpaF